MMFLCSQLDFEARFATTCLKVCKKTLLKGCKREGLDMAFLFGSTWRDIV